MFHPGVFRAAHVTIYRLRPKQKLYIPGILRSPGECDPADIVSGQRGTGVMHKSCG